jgi:hypothetical protein
MHITKLQNQRKLRFWMALQQQLDMTENTRFNYFTKKPISHRTKSPPKRPGAQVYDEQFVHALTIVWNTANQICSKRLVPFIPNLVSAMERHGHLRVTQEIRDKLLKVSPATVDRLLQTERRRHAGGISHTKTGTLLKIKYKSGRLQTGMMYHQAF